MLAGLLFAGGFAVHYVVFPLQTVEVLPPSGLTIEHPVVESLSHLLIPNKIRSLAERIKHPYHPSTYTSFSTTPKSVSAPAVSTLSAPAANTTSHTSNTQTTQSNPAVASNPTSSTASASPAPVSTTPSATVPPAETTSPTPTPTSVPPPTCSISAPSTVSSWQNYTLSWSSSNAQGATLSFHDSQGFFSVDTSDSLIDSFESGSQTWYLDVTGKGGSGSCQTTVTIRP